LQRRDTGFARKWGDPAFLVVPLSLVQAVFSASIIIPIILAYVLYREHLTRNRLIAIVLAIVSVTLIGLQR
jgi:drug/metabolite transporter (DMT)-like permease